MRASSLKKGDIIRRTSRYDSKKYLFLELVKAGGYQRAYIFVNSANDVGGEKYTIETRDLKHFEYV